MKSNILFYVFLAGVLLFGCKNDDGELKPSYSDIDWFRISPSDDLLDGLRYDIYKEKGISIFYNDTIGSQYRGISGYGDSVIHYEILDLCYTIEENNPSVAYTLSRDREKLYEAVKFLRQEVIPLIPVQAYPKSFFLVKELILNTTSSSLMREGTVLKGMMTTTLGHAEEIVSLQPEMRHEFAALIAANVTGYYAVDKGMTVELENFFGYTEKLAEWEDADAGRSIYEVLVDSYYDEASGNHPAYDTWYGFGFLEPNPDARDTDLDEYTTPTWEQDLAAYLREVILTDNNVDAFKEKVSKELEERKEDIIQIFEDIVRGNLTADDKEGFTAAEINQMVREQAEEIVADKMVDYLEFATDKYQLVQLLWAKLKAEE